MTRLIQGAFPLIQEIYGDDLEPSTILSDKCFESVKSCLKIIALINKVPFEGPKIK